MKLVLLKDWTCW